MNANSSIWKTITTFLADSNTILLITMLGIAVAALLVYHIRANRPPATGPAAVVSRRVEMAKFSTGSAHSKTNNWNYMVTFRLSDGEEIELYVAEPEYKELTEGLQGQLTWKNDNLVTFFPDCTP